MAGLSSVQNGISEAVRHQRLLLFGNNEIDVEGKSTISLLLDEVISLLSFELGLMGFR